jgi:hypothetical protein
VKQWRSFFFIIQNCQINVYIDALTLFQKKKIPKLLKAICIVRTAAFFEKKQ